MTIPRSGTGEDSGGERWGWELRDPLVTVPVPFEEPPPRPAAPAARWSAGAARRLDRGGRTVSVLGGCLAVVFGGAAVVVHRTFSGEDLYDRYGVWGTVALVAVALIALYVAVRPLLVRTWTDARYRRWHRRCLRAQASVSERSVEWARRRAEHENRHAPEDADQTWVPLRPETTQRVDVYGGEPAGCATLLAGVASSVIESGAQVTVADLSQDGLAHRLVDEVSARGYDVAVGLLPEQLGVSALLHDLPPSDIGAVLAESVHALDRDVPAGGDKGLDAMLVEQACACLSAPVTFARLGAALRVATHQGAPDADVDALLEPAEQRGLADLLGEGTVRATDERLFRLVAAAQRLASVEGSDAIAAQGPGGGAALRAWELSDRVPELAGDLMAQVLFHAVVHRIRIAPPANGSQVLVVTGCDRLRRSHLERLDQLARRRGLRLILFFRHLREDAVDLLGGGEAVVFLRLGNAKEAENAANFIGKEHRVVASQFTVSRSASWSTTSGTSTSESEGDQESVTKGQQWGRNRNFQHSALIDFPHDTGSRSRGGQRSTTTGRSTSVTAGTNTSEQYGGSTGDSLAYQRVYEFSVEPTLLQRLSSTAFVLVDPRDQGSPRLGDCAQELDAENLPRLRGGSGAGADSADGVAGAWKKVRGEVDARGTAPDSYIPESGHHRYGPAAGRRRS